MLSSQLFVKCVHPVCLFWNNEGIEFTGVERETLREWLDLNEQELTSHLSGSYVLLHCYETFTVID